MPYSFDVFRYQYQLVLDFTAHLACFRCLRKKSPSDNFWIRTSNAHLEASISDWCKVFGSDRSNPTHWKHTPTPENGEFEEGELEAHEKRFRELVQAETGMSIEDWESYHAEMLAIRNRFVAHMEVDKKLPKVPLMDIALNVALAYEKWIFELLGGDSYEGETVQQIYDKSYREAEEAVPKET